MAAVAAELFPIQIGRLRYVGSDFVLWLALPTVGPTAALVVTTGGIVVDAVLHRVPLRLALGNVSTFAAVTAGGSALLLAGRESGLTEPGGAGLPLAVALIAWTGTAASLLLLRLGSPLMRGLPVREVVKRHLTPVLPWQTLTGGLAAGTVHAYYTIGPGTIVAALLVQGLSLILLTTIEREQRQRDEVHRAFAARDRFLAEALDAEARERRRVALELHDDTLQNLLAARQDLAEGALGSADERVAAAVAEMRRLVTRTYDVHRETPDLRERLRELVDLLTAQRGFSFSLDVRATGGGHDDLIVACTRELVVNALKHSHGSHVRVEVAEDAGAPVLTVTDDGTGFQPGTSAQRLRAGHMGLAVVRDRLAAIGGDVHISRAPQGGAVVRALLPRPGSEATEPLSPR